MLFTHIKYEKSNDSFWSVMFTWSKNYCLKIDLNKNDTVFVNQSLVYLI